MEFELEVANDNNLHDSEIKALLNHVYVEGGFATEHEAESIFAPKSERLRGDILIARSKSNRDLAGMVILVPPESDARKMAKDNDVEMHLLGVDEKYRGTGLGATLIDRVIQVAKDNRYSNMLLWTQAPMMIAQFLYEKAGFQKIDTVNRNGREFYVYRLAL